MDEVGSALVGLSDTNAATLRRAVLYPVYFSGGNIEWYFGYHPLPLGGDMRTEDFRTREEMYRYMRYAREMMQEQLPFWEMIPADELHSTPGAQVFAKAADTYAVYLADARQSGTLTVAPGNYRQRWFNPRNGLFEGTATTVSASAQNPDLTLGSAPNTQGQDWVIVFDKTDTDPTAGNPDTDTTPNNEAVATTDSESTDSGTPNNEAPIATTEDTTITETPDNSNGNSEVTVELNAPAPDTGNAQPTPTAELLATFNPALADKQQESTSTVASNSDSGGATDLWFLLVLLATLLAVGYARKPDLAKNNMS